MKTFEYIIATLFICIILVSSVNGIASLSHEGTGTSTTTVKINNTVYVTNNITNYVTSFNNITNNITTTINLTNLVVNNITQNITNLVMIENNFTNNITNNIYVPNLTINTINNITNNISNIYNYTTILNYSYYMISISNYLMAGNNTPYIDFNETLLNKTIKNICIQNNTNAILNNLNVTGNISFTLPYGMFSDTTTQTATSSGGVYYVSFNTNETSYQITHFNPTTFFVQKNGYYFVEVSALVGYNNNITGNINLWFLKGGIAIPRSNTIVTSINNSQIDLVVPIIVYLTTVDSFQVAWVGSNNFGKIFYTNSSGLIPETPSVIMTMKKISD